MYMDNRTMVSPNRAQEHQYNLTIDQLGKPLNTMKLDELLKNVISAEDSQFLQNINPSSSSSSSSSSSASSFLGNFDLNGKKKVTIDEVWKDIILNQENVNAIENQSRIHQETTLEDFLVRSGVTNIGNNQNGLFNIPHHHQPIVGMHDPMADWLQLQMAAVQRQQMSVLDSSTNFHASESSSSVYHDKSSIIGHDHGGYGENQMGMTIPVSAISTTASSESQAVVIADKKRQYSDEIMEKTIERRQKRMIKNRESAARSRARKQAYTNKLEHEVFHLRETNTWLKKFKEVEMLLSSDLTPTPRYQLRRTSSASI
ncbi:hypothetical protein JCGZ_12017 [Jatropha curcas]|uniref:BZIP domain-containing protein n=1 Tax=Jatropha curcas TaxID=180498 RepID=A0A067KKF2_JATCU|nr:ABSCISIC ACID-INSENSITIVE 5-like protein 2 [Jatropha curcas]KDP32725.1 hypothetical protein JCGZ_12017 [Jatropha curcas]